MAQVASCGFMIWNGKSKGILTNILNLLQLQKKILVYFLPDKSYYKLKSPKDLTTLLKKCSIDTREMFKLRNLRKRKHVIKGDPEDLVHITWDKAVNIDLL